ncbi:MAG TPA: hypothetical protein VFW25_09125 [Silvibacterium sp.]|nr:hypothetical protein [Silvibacterium sp.]
MRVNPRRLLLPVLGAVALVTLGPSALHAQNTKDQRASSTTKTKGRRMRANVAKSGQSANEADSSASTTTAAMSASKRSSERKSEAANAATEQNNQPKASTSASTPAESPRTTAKSERRHASTSTAHAQTPPSPGTVWVNTESKVYHMSGSKWYGKTKQGQWMTEAEAQKAGCKSAKE